MFEVKLKSQMDRSLIFAELNYKGIKIAIGTVHLESLNNESIRDVQLNSIFSAL